MVRIFDGYEVEPTPSYRALFSAPLQSDGAVRFYDVGVASASWIPKDMKERFGLPEVDAYARWVDRNTALYEDFFTSSDRDDGQYRFTSVMLVRVVLTGATISTARYVSSDAHTTREYAGMSTARSFLGTPVQVIDHEAQDPVMSEDARSVHFRQVAICRTRAPEILSAGSSAPLFSSSTASSVAGILGPAMLAGLSGVCALVLGRVLSFSPIWSDLELRVRNDGSCELSVAGSHFPSMAVFVAAGDHRNFSGPIYAHDGTLTNRYSYWTYRGWDFAPKGYGYDQSRSVCRPAMRANPISARIRHTTYSKGAPQVWRRLGRSSN